METCAWKYGCAHKLACMRHTGVLLSLTQEEPTSLCAEHQGKESSAGLREDAAEGRGRLELIPGPPLASAARLGHSSWTAGLPEQVRALASPPSQRHSGQPPALMLHTPLKQLQD